MNAKMFYVLVCAINMSACVSQYSAIPDQPSAKVRFNTNIDRVTAAVMMYVYDRQDCSKGDFGGIIGRLGGAMNFSDHNGLGMFDPPDFTKHLDYEVIIPADRDVMLGFKIGANPAFIPCYESDMDVIFKPLAGRQYEAQYKLRDGRCNVELYELALNNSNDIERVEVKPVTVKYSDCFR